MPIIGIDKKATEEAKRKMQERYEAIKQDIDEIRLELLKDKDYPLNQRTSKFYNTPIELLITYPGLERQHSRDYIENLKKSIEESGMLHKPICTLDFDSVDKDFRGINALIPPAEKESNKNMPYLYVVCGNARVQAAKELGYYYIDVVIKYLTPDDAFQLSLTENEEREGLNPIDRALLFKNWIDKTGISQSEIARRRNKTQGWVSQTLRLLTLPKKVQELIREGKVSFNQANLILQVDDADIQTKLAELCADGISENDLKEKIRQAKLKVIPINALIPPAPIEPDITPPRPVIPPPPPLSKILTDSKPKSEVEIVNDYIKKAIDKALDIIKGKEEKYGRLFPARLLVMSVITEKCDGNCNNCKYAEGCIKFLTILQQYYHISIPSVYDIVDSWRQRMLKETS